MLLHVLSAGLCVALSMSTSSGTKRARGEATSSAALVHRVVTNALLSDDSLDVPGILWLEHLNLLTGPKEMANQFYIDFLGFVAEPGRSWHVNMGSQQLHLAEAAPGNEHVLTGDVALSVPSLKAVRTRAARARQALEGSLFEVADEGDHLRVTCPWGNRFVLREAAAVDAVLVAALEAARAEAAGTPKMERIHVGMDESASVRAVGGAGIRYVSFRARRGTVERIGRFYSEMLGARVHVARHASGPLAATAAVLVGPSVHLVFYEGRDRDLTDGEQARQAGGGARANGGEGLHVCVYVGGFRRAYEGFAARGLAWTNPRFAHLDRCDSWEEAHASRQFRFKAIIDLETGEELLELEHEVRAQRHSHFFKRTHYPDGSGL